MNLTSDVNSLLTIKAITPKFMKAFMKVVILTNIGSNKGCHKSVVIAIVTSVAFESKDDPTQMTKIVIYNYILYYIQKTIHSKLICTNVHS